MNYVFRSTVCAILVAGLGQVAAASDANQFMFGIDVNYTSTDAMPSWTEGGTGKLRHPDGAEFGLTRGFIDFKRRLLPTLSGHVAVDIYTDDLGPPASITEAYLAWRPVPKSPNRYRLKAGFFYPTLSLENSGPGWSSPYTRTSSAINTWIAEEVRTLGVEASVQRRPLAFNRAHEFVIYGAAFYGNDPAGTLLAWRGWTIHDRQSRVGDRLPMPPLPLFQPGERLSYHQDHVAPFDEIDQTPGYYGGIEWRVGKRLRIRATHYDNHGDPIGFASGQYSWDTSFDHLGIQALLPGRVELIAQWMSGKTDMGPEIDGAYMVDTNFDASFLLLSKRVGPNRVSVRYDDFRVLEDDNYPMDNNNDGGHAWTLNWQYRYSDAVSFYAEALSLSGRHDGRMYYGDAPRARERQFELGIAIHLGNHRGS